MERSINYNDHAGGGNIHASGRRVESMIVPPNNRFVRLTALGLEVGEAYSRCIRSILAHPDLSGWKYILTREHDNAMPSDGFVQLARRMEEHPEYAAIGGLYFYKGQVDARRFGVTQTIIL